MVAWLHVFECAAAKLDSRANVGLPDCWMNLPIFAEEIPEGEVTSYISVFVGAALTGLLDQTSH